MTRPPRGARASRVGRACLALALVLAWAAAPVAASAQAAYAFETSGSRVSTVGADAALATWDGSVNLYRTGVFSTQKTWYYCTAADVQIMRNIVRHEERHGRTAQDRYFDYMRAHMRYAIPVKQGVDPAGWTAGLRHYVDDRYRLVRSDTFGSLLRSAVRSLRRTNLPVALFVDHGNHGWVLHGFTATADPAVTSDFTVTSVRVSGPLWGLQNATYGYDMKPNKKLTKAQLRDFVSRWHYGPIRMVYEGEFLSIQPIGTTSLASAAEAPTAGLVAGADDETRPGPTTISYPSSTPAVDTAGGATPTPAGALAASAGTLPPSVAGPSPVAGWLVAILALAGLALVVMRLGHTVRGG
jgi:hypothetical protein